MGALQELVARRSEEQLGIEERLVGAEMEPGKSEEQVGRAERLPWPRKWAQPEGTEQKQLVREEKRPGKGAQGPEGEGEEEGLWRLQTKGMKHGRPVWAAVQVRGWGEEEGLAGAGRRHQYGDLA